MKPLIGAEITSSVEQLIAVSNGAPFSTVYYQRDTKQFIRVTFDGQHWHCALDEIQCHAPMCAES